jgi:mono/diheme cytochrome c family protein
MPIKQILDADDNVKFVRTQHWKDEPVKFVAGLVLGLILIPLGAYLYFTGGSAPVATTDSDMPFENFFAHKALNARIAKDMPKNIPIQPTEANYVAGAELYKQNCAVCHGVPLTPKTAIATGMYPHPPLLFEGKGVTDDQPGESYWKIFNGIRLSGMPGFSKTLTETQMWQIALLIANADKLPPSAKAAVVAPIGTPAPATNTPPTATPPPSSNPAQPTK